MYTGYVRNLLIAEDDNNSRAVAVAAGEQIAVEQEVGAEGSYRP